MAYTVEWPPRSGSYDESYEYLVEDLKQTQSKFSLSDDQMSEMMGLVWTKKILDFDAAATVYLKTRSN